MQWVPIASVAAAAFSAVAAIASAAIAVLAWRAAKRALIQQSLQVIHQEEASPQMLDAVRSLWDLRRANSDAFVDEYERIRLLQQAQADTLEGQERIEFVSSTLHHKRRLVSHFYMHLAQLVDTGVLSSDHVYAHWRRSDLSIIPELLVPLESALAGTLGLGRPSRNFERMVALYDNAPVD